MEDVAAAVASVAAAERTTGPKFASKSNVPLMILAMSLHVGSRVLQCLPQSPALGSSCLVSKLDELSRGNE